MRHRVARIALLGAVALTHRADAQGPGAGVEVRGLAFDSLRGQPLSGATVAILGVSQNAITDARGRFRFERVPAGVHMFVVHHVALDSIGLSGLKRRAPVTEVQSEVTLAVPSFASLWAAMCGDRPAPPDSGFIYGTIRDVRSRTPVADATVDLTWFDLRYGKLKGLEQKSLRLETSSDSTGSYGICGVPNVSWVRIAAGAASGASGRIDLGPSDLRVRRLDLLIGSAMDTDTLRRGTIMGSLTELDGRPFGDARVVVDDTAEVRAGENGRFIMRNVPVGTRQVEVFSLGMVPVMTAVDVYPDDTARVALQLRKVTTLDVVRVLSSRRGRALAEALEERRRDGFGHMMEAGEIARHATLATALGEIPSLIVRQGTFDFVVFMPNGRGGECSPAVWIDGARMDYAALNMLHPTAVVALEVFPRTANVPLQFRQVEMNSGCGVILAWTSRGFQ